MAYGANRLSQHVGFGVQGLGPVAFPIQGAKRLYRDIAPTMDHQTEEKLENQMKSRVICWFTGTSYVLATAPTERESTVGFMLSVFYYTLCSCN